MHTQRLLPVAVKSVSSYGSLPASFELNRGQTDGRVRFLAHEGDATLFLSARSMVFSLHALHYVKTVSTGLFGTPHVAVGGMSSHIQISFHGASPSAHLVGLHRLPGTVNYFRGDDPTKWRTGIPTYAEVLDRNVYPHIDVVFHGTQQQPEYDWIVKPGADPRVIKLQLSGAEKLRIDGHGNLLTGIGNRTLLQSRPRVYQLGRHGKTIVLGQYQRLPHGAFGFRVGRYDRTLPLVIDPVISYSTYLGGSSGDRGLAVAVDEKGDAYVGGIAGSSDFPIVRGPQKDFGGDQDAFVAKLNPAGTALLYSTYLGGERTDEALAIAVDSTGDAYITGDSLSTDYPTLHPLQATNHSTCEVGGTSVPCSNAILTEINPTGEALVYSTYLGGDSEDQGYGIAVDTHGNAYVTGKTDSDRFPTVNPLQATKGGALCTDSTGHEAPCTDAFVSKVSASGSSLLYSTYFGGTDNEEGTGIAIDAAGFAYITGLTWSSDLPTARPFQRALASEVGPDAFVAKLSLDGGSLVYASYLGGNNGDQAINIAVDNVGAAYVTGYTRSSDFPVVHAYQSSPGGCADNSMDPAACIDAFVSKINPSGSGLEFSTYVGGSGDDSGFGISVDARGDVFISGDTTSANFPVADATQSTIGGATDAFVSELGPSGNTLIESTFLGGSGDDFGSGIALDSAGNAYVTGFTFSPNYPVVGAIHSGHGSDAFITKLGSAPLLTPTPQPTQTPTATSVPTATSARVPHPSKKCRKGYKRVRGTCKKK